MPSPPFQPIVPPGAFDSAQSAREALKAAVLALLRANASGLRNIEVAAGMGLRSPSGTPQKNYLTWALLQELQRENRIRKIPGKQPRFVAVPDAERDPAPGPPPPA